MKEIEELDAKFKDFQRRCDPKHFTEEDYNKWMGKVNQFLDARLALMKKKGEK